jgi:transposase
LLLFCSIDTPDTLQAAKSRKKVLARGCADDGKSRPEFEAFALTLMREMPVKKAGEILGETDQRLWRMLHAHVEAARARAEWSEVVWLGADKMNRKKGHNYMTVFADLVKKQVLFGSEGKDASVWSVLRRNYRHVTGIPRPSSR